MLTIPLDQFTADEIMQLAYEGLQVREATLKTKIIDLRARLGERPEYRADSPVENSTLEQPRKRRTLSAGARKRIALAQKKRWAAFHEAQATSK